MSPKLVITYAVTDDVATLRLSDTDGLRPLFPVTVAGTGTAVDGTHTVTAVDSTLDEITVALVEPDTPTTDVLGQLTVPVTWITDADVVPFLGFSPVGDDADYLSLCVDSANEWCFDRRYAAGYTDLPQLLPGDRVKQGAVLRAAMLYRERGSVDSFQTWDTQTGTGGPVGSIGQVLGLLGVGRAAIG